MVDLVQKYNILLRSFFMASLILVLPSVGLAKQQSALLDANGKPLSNEVLKLLSSGASLLAPPKKIKPSSVPSKKELKVLQQKGKGSKNKKKASRSTPELEQELLESLLVGNTARARHLVKSGVRVNYKNYKGETPLSVAVDKAWASMVVSLLEGGADIDQKNSKGLSLLHHATSKGYVDLSKVLIKNGLKPSSTTSKKWNSLHVASRFGRWQLVQLYLQMGVDPNKRTSDGKTALEIAQIVRHQGIIKILSAVTTARPTGRAANYNRRENRRQYQEIASKKQERLMKKREILRDKLRNMKK